MSENNYESMLEDLPDLVRVPGDIATDVLFRNKIYVFRGRSDVAVRVAKYLVAEYITSAASPAEISEIFKIN